MCAVYGWCEVVVCVVQCVDGMWWWGVCVAYGWCMVVVVCVGVVVCVQCGWYVVEGCVWCVCMLSGAKWGVGWGLP